MNTLWPFDDPYAPSGANVTLLLPGTSRQFDGTLLYTIGVAPADQFSSYRNVFDRVLSSLRASR